MAYTGKTNWQNNEIVEASDMNRIEQGISDVDVGLGNVQEEVTTHKAEIASSTQLGHVKVGQNLAIDSNGTLHAQASDGKKVARFIIGTSTAGWTEKDCDYLCDGTNDQVEINNAIAALPAGGGEVVILDGTYDITATINVNEDNVSIRGNGNATVLKRMWDSSSGEGVITLTSVQGCRVENLQIDGNKATYGSPHNYGIYLSSLSSNNTITDNTWNNNANKGIYLELSDNNTITGNICNNNSSYGIYLRKSSNNTVTGNNCNNNYGDGIYLVESSNNTVTGNNCNNDVNNNGIYLYLSSKNTITGNTCNNNYGDGIYLAESSNDNVITGNTCYNNDQGIQLRKSSNNTVTGNTCNGNYGNGIHIYLSSSSNNTATGNTCNNNGNYGIELRGSSNNTVTGNTCNNNYFGGIWLYSSSNNTITGNTCIRGTGTSADYTAYKYTIQLEGTGSNYNLISSNNCMGKAVVISDGTGNSAWGNKYDSGDDLPI